MFTSWLTMSAMLAVNPPALAAEKTEVDGAIERGLAYLQRSQNADGSWRGGPGTPKNVAVTALSVMAFLSAGHVPGEGRYGITVDKGIDWVLGQQQRNGLIASDGGHEMYHHGISTLMLAEVAGMTGGNLAGEVRRELVKAVEVILQAQRLTPGQQHGGWRYHLDPRRDYPQTTDLSVTGWQLLALRAAKNLGCDIPTERIDWAVAYIQRCHDPNTGGYCYDPGRAVTVGCTGTGILGLELCGKERHQTPQALKAGSYLINHPPHWGSDHFFYSIYYCGQATFQLGGNYWNFYKPQLHKVLLNNQSRTDSSWLGGDAGSRLYGPHYCTAMAVLALTVEYRLLPIYQRGEEPAEPAKGSP
jgi:hypothetical protein